jgi:hypothetical protein
VLLIVTAIAGSAFADSVRAALSGQLNGLVGGQGADLVKSLLTGSTDPAAGTIATLLGIVTLLERFTNLLNLEGFRFIGEYDSRCWLGLEASIDGQTPFQRPAEAGRRGGIEG